MLNPETRQRLMCELARSLGERFVEAPKVGSTLILDFVDALEAEYSRRDAKRIADGLPRMRAILGRIVERGDLESFGRRSVTIASGLSKAGFPLEDELGVLSDLARDGKPDAEITREEARVVLGVFEACERKLREFAESH